MLKFDRPTLVTITAPTCSGKTFLMEELERVLGFKRIVSTTTRPNRLGEVDGKDYYFIDDDTSKKMEANGEFIELIEFRKIRYGVTAWEMNEKMNGITPPMVILEPQGLQEYKKICTKNSWDIFTVYVSTIESERIKRLIERTSVQLQAAAIDRYENREKTLTNRSHGFNDLEKIVKAHTDRLLSITTEERLWSNASSWDLIVPGDNIEKALEYITLGVQLRNRKCAEQTPYTHTA